MADAADTTAPTEAATDTGTETQATSETAAPETDPFESGADTFDRTYVEKLRKENAGYRTRANEAKPFADAFEGLHADDAQALLSLVDAVKNDPNQAAALMRQFADVLTPAEQAEVRGAAAEAAGAAPTDAPLTRAEFDKLMSQREEQQAVAQATADLNREAKELGYDPDSLEYPVLLKIALEKTAGDLKAADEAIKEWKQGFIDDFVNGKRNDANNSPLVSEAPGAPATNANTPKTFAEAKAAANEFLKNLA